MTYRVDRVLGPSTVVAVDVGGTQLKGAAVTCGGVVRAAERIATATDDGPDAVATQIEQLVRAMAEAALSQTGELPLAAGVVVPGVIDADMGLVRYAANIGWEDLDLGARVRKVLDVPVILGNDARAAAVAEATFGAARGVDNFFAIGIGTGIGGSMVLDGIPHDGEHGLAGEIGHIQAVADGPLCNCGERGCLETIASASAIRRRYLERGGDRHVAIQASDVLRRAALGGDRVAVGVRDEAIGALAFVLTIVQRIVDLDLVVIGGGLGAAGDALAVPLNEELRRRASFQPAPRVLISDLGPEAGCRGAGVMAWDFLGRHPSPEGCAAE
jgi:glucokinase